MIFSEKHKPRISDLEKNGRISLSALLGMMEDTASHQCTYVGDDVMQSLKKGSVWVCTNWRIRFLEELSGVNELEVSTWARNNNTRASVLREYSICDREGSEVLIAEAKFVRFDLSAGKPTPISDELNKAYDPEEKGVFPDEMSRLLPPEHYETSKTVTLRTSDIDFNGHVHNTRYLEIAASGMPEDGPDLRKAYEISIAFRKPILETDTVTVNYSSAESGCYISLCNDKGACCYIQALWRDVDVHL